MLHARLSSSLRSALCALCVVVAGAWPSPARAQSVPLVTPVSGPCVEQLAKCADVGAQPLEVVAAYRVYLKGLQKLQEQQASELDRAREQSRTAPGALLTVRDMIRCEEIADRTTSEHRSLVQALGDAILAHAPEAAADRAAAVRGVLGLWVVEASLDQTGSSNAPLSLADILLRPSLAQLARGTKGAPAVLFALAATNLPARVTALQVLAAACRTSRLDAARQAEEGQLVGQDMGLLNTGNSLVWGPCRGLDGYEGGAHTAMKDLIAAELPVLEASESQLTLQQLDALQAPLWQRNSSLMILSREGDLLTPSQAAQSFLRHSGLTSAQRQGVRESAWRLAAALRAQARTNLAAKAQGRDVPEEPPTDVIAAVEALARAAGMEMKVETQRGLVYLPKLDKGAALADEDAAEFGAADVEAEEELTARRAAMVARWRVLPSALTVKEWAALARQLGLPPDADSVLSAVRADAAERWAKEVAPLAEGMEKDNATINRLLEQDHAGQGDAFAEELARSSRQRAAMFAAADACDDAMFAALGAALGSRIAPGTLPIARAARSYHWDHRSIRLTAAAEADQPFNLAAAALAIAATEPDGAAVLAACVPLQQLFRECGRAVTHACLTQRLSEYAFDATQREIGRHSTGQDQRMADVQVQTQQAVAAFKKCKAALLEAVRELGGDQRVEAWKSGLNRFQYPNVYLTPRIDRALEAHNAQRPALLLAQRECWAVGDMLCAIFHKMPPEAQESVDRATQHGVFQEIGQRAEALSSLRTSLDWCAARQAELAQSTEAPTQAPNQP